MLLSSADARGSITIRIIRIARAWRGEEIALGRFPVANITGEPDRWTKGRETDILRHAVPSRYQPRGRTVPDAAKLDARGTAALPPSATTRPGRPTISNHCIPPLP